MHSRLWPCEGEKKWQVVNSKGREGTRSFRDLKAVPKSVQNEVTQGSQGEGRRVRWRRRGEGRQTGQPARPRSPDLPAGRGQWEEARAGGAASGTARTSRHASPRLHLTRKPRQPGLRLRVEAPWVSASRTHHLPFRLRMPEQLTAENGGT